MSTEPLPDIEFPTTQDFCVQIPLYQKIDVDMRVEREVYDLICESVNIDCFCIECGKPSVFASTHVNIGSYQYFTLEDRFFGREFRCSRVDTHSLYFTFILKENSVTKVGQFPSQADLTSHEIRKYKKILTNDEFKELSRAIGLISHGVGIGAFVYLRRILENLVEEAHIAEAAKPGWDDEQYTKSRFSDRIHLLKHALPPFLSGNAYLYSILSKGIHELSEQDCLDAFPVVKLAVELVLDGKLEAKERELKFAAVEKELNILKGKHK